MNLPRKLQWIELDSAEAIATMQGLFANETPVCDLQRIVSEPCSFSGRRAMLGELANRAKKVLVVEQG